MISLLSKLLNSNIKACLLLVLTLVSQNGFSKSEPINISSFFTENKGQIGDQNYKPRPDVLFAGTEGPLTFHLRKTGISYQQFRTDKWTDETDPITNKKIKLPSQTTIYRVDANWLNSNSDPVVEKKFPTEGVSNFYLTTCPNGVFDVKTFQEVIYKNIYKGIDARWYHKDGHLKYDYLVAAGADHTSIQVEIKGAKLSINSIGELIIETPLGKIVEDAPYVTQNGKALKSKWIINGNVVSFQIDNIDPLLPLVIDPGVRIWGTYYGGNGGDSALNNAVDANGNVWIGGTTSSNNGTSIATIGSHQSVYGGGADNAYIAKFNSAGVRQWGTYYGGPVREFGFNIAIDVNGNSYLCGQSLGSSGTIIGTVGSHQPTFAGTADGWVVKFNGSGVRQWGTFYGDTGLDVAYGVAADASGNVYLVGKTDAPTSNVISTSGVHQQNFGGIEDGFIVKFNSAGTRQWGTYYGGTGTDVARNVHVDAAGNIYVTGWTDNSVPNVIGTAGAHQNVYGGGGYDAFLAKFSPAGLRLWGTHYGGNDVDMAYDCETDLLGNVYVAGKTTSTNSVSTVGCHQPSYGGGSFDAFLVSLNATTGTRNWATYYGGSGDEESWGCSVHKSGHIMMTGHTGTSGGTVIATPGSHKPTFGGGLWDAFMVQFDPSTNGTRTWGSYFGGSDDDVGYGCSSDNAYHFYMTGSTFSTPGTDIATVGSHQPSYGGGLFGDAYLQKFYDCPAPLAPTNTTVPANLSFCEGVTTTLSAISGASMSWYSNATSTSVIGTGSVYVTPVLSAGVYTYYVDAATCTNSPRTPISVTVFALPNLNVVAFPTLVCAGKNSTLNVTGAASYTWDSSANTNTLVVTPASTSIYTVSGTNTLGCTNSKTISVTVYPLDPVTFTPAKDTSCLHIFGGTPILLVGSPSGGVFSGANVSGNYLNPTALGIFNPVYTYTNPTNGCVNSATATILVVNCTSVKEENAFIKNISIYPNPTKGNIVIETNSDIEKTITLLDARGRTIRTETSKQKTLQYSIADEANGIYFIKISSVLGNKEFKLVKE